MCVYYTVRVRRVLRISRTRCYILLVMRCLYLYLKNGKVNTHRTPPGPRACLPPLLT